MVDANVLDYNAIVDHNTTGNLLTQTFSDPNTLSKATEIVNQNNPGLNLILEVLKPFTSTTQLFFLNPVLVVLLFVETWLLAQLLMFGRKMLPIFIRKFVPEGLVYIISFLLVYSFIFVASLIIVFNYFGGS